MTTATRPPAAGSDRTAAPATVPDAAPSLALPEISGELFGGPWTSAFVATVSGRVRSKSNYRNDRRGSWAPIRDYETAVAVALRAARPASWPPVEHAAASPPRIVAVLLARTGLDAGNLSKSVLDAAEGVVYADDAQVAAVCDVVEPAGTGLGLLAAFAVVPDSGTLRAMAAQAALLDRVRELCDVPF